MITEEARGNPARDESRPAGYRITLVHGTRFFWDRLAKRYAGWARADSSFAYRLRDELGIPVTFAEFRWSGANSQRARATAVRGLVKDVTDASFDPRCPHFVVAHSHGGNVALMACHSDEFRQRIHGIVCLATPFLIVTSRLSSARWQRWMSMAGVLVGGFGLIAAFLAAGWLIRSAPLWTIPIGMFALLFLVVGLFGLLESLGRFALPADSVLPTSVGVPVLAVRTPGDEAAGALMASRFFGQLAEHAWSVPARLIERIDALPGRLLGRPVTTTSILVPATMLVGAVLLFLSWLSGSQTWFQWFALVYPITLLFIVPAILFIPAVLLSMLTALPFGWDLALRAAAWDIQVEMDYGESDRCRLDQPDAEGFRHTSCVDHRDCAPRIAAWMRRQGARPATSVPAGP